jgi:hypothetical protein
MLPLSAALLVAACQASQTAEVEALSLEERLSEPREAQWQARREQILAESAALEIPWAGHYYQDNGFTGSAVFVAPWAGFAFSRFGCLGTYDRNLGSIEREGREIILTPEWQAPKGERLNMPERLTVVPWGERTYLLEEEDFIEFCNWINSGYEPRGGWSGLFSLNTDSFDEEPTGLPDLPEQYQGYILEQPIEARILSIGSWATDATDDWTYRATVTVDVGARDGAFKGMWLLGEDCDVWIEEVGSDSSKGRIEVFAETLETEAGVGTGLSTSSGVMYSWLVEDV